MNWSNLLYLVAIAFSIIVCIVNIVVNRKSKKTNNNQNVVNAVGDVSTDVEKNTVNTSEGFWSELWQKIPQYMISAEQFYNQLVGKNSGIKTGAQKLAQVLDKIKIDCLTAGVSYDEDKAVNMVKELCDLTNQVNTNK